MKLLDIGRKISREGTQLVLKGEEDIDSNNSLSSSHSEGPGKGRGLLRLYMRSHQRGVPGGLGHCANGDQGVGCGTEVSLLGGGMEGRGAVRGRGERTKFAFKLCPGRGRRGGAEKGMKVGH